MAEKEYIELEAVNALIEAECSPKVAAFLNHAIDNIPAADVRPVVRGEWEESADQLQASCSVCKTSFPCWRMWPANFCPNCGADMRGES